MSGHIYYVVQWKNDDESQKAIDDALRAVCPSCRFQSSRCNGTLKVQRWDSVSKMLLEEHEAGYLDWVKMQATPGGGLQWEAVKSEVFEGLISKMNPNEGPIILQGLWTEYGEQIPVEAAQWNPKAPVLSRMTIEGLVRRDSFASRYEIRQEGENLRVNTYAMNGKLLQEFLLPEGGWLMRRTGEKKSGLFFRSERLFSRYFGVAFPVTPEPKQDYPKEDIPEPKQDYPKEDIPEPKQDYPKEDIVGALLWDNQEDTKACLPEFFRFELDTGAEAPIAVDEKGNLSVALMGTAISNPKGGYVLSAAPGEWVIRFIDKGMARHGFFAASDARFWRVYEPKLMAYLKTHTLIDEEYPYPIVREGSLGRVTLARWVPYKGQLVKLKSLEALRGMILQIYHWGDFSVECQLSDSLQTLRLLLKGSDGKVIREFSLKAWDWLEKLEDYVSVLRDEDFQARYAGRLHPVPDEKEAEEERTEADPRKPWTEERRKAIASLIAQDTIDKAMEDDGLSCEEVGERMQAIMSVLGVEGVYLPIWEPYIQAILGPKLKSDRLPEGYRAYLEEVL